jgi:hypothetical protein
VLGDAGGVGALEHEHLQRRGKQLRVVDVGAFDLDPERAA